MLDISRVLTPRHAKRVILNSPPRERVTIKILTKRNQISFFSCLLYVHRSSVKHQTTPAIMAANGDKYGNDPDSESDSAPGSPNLDAHDHFEDLDHDHDHDNDHDHDHDHAEELEEKPVRSALKKSSQKEPAPVVARPILPSQTDPKDLDVTTLTPLTPEIIARQATINIGTIGHVAHGKSTVVKAISGVQTVRFKNELERNITIKLGYANAKIYKCDNEDCPRPTCYRSFKSEKEVDPPCEREGCTGTYRLLRHVS